MRGLEIFVGQEPYTGTIQDINITNTETGVGSITIKNAGVSITLPVGLIISPEQELTGVAQAVQVDETTFTNQSVSSATLTPGQEVLLELARVTSEPTYADAGYTLNDVVVYYIIITA